MNCNDNFVLVAPRPVRLTAANNTVPFTHFQNAIHRPQTRVATMRLVGDGVDRLKLGDDVPPQEDAKLDQSEKDLASPRASPRSVGICTPRSVLEDAIAAIWLGSVIGNVTLIVMSLLRSNLPSEAIEEFLSILQSSAMRFPPTSPILRASNANMPHAFFYRRPTPGNLSPSHSSEGLGLSFADPADEIRMETTTPAYPFKLIGGPLGS